MDARAIYVTHQQPHHRKRYKILLMVAISAYWSLISEGKTVN